MSDKLNNLINNNNNNQKNKVKKINELEENNYNSNPNPNTNPNTNKFNKNKRKRWNRKKNINNSNSNPNPNPNPNPNQLVLQKNTYPENSTYPDYWFYINPPDLTKLNYHYLQNSFDYNNYYSNFNSNSNSNSNSNYYNNNVVEDTSNNKISNGTQTGDESLLNTSINYNSNPFTWSEEFEKNILEKLKSGLIEPVKQKEFKWIKFPSIMNLDDLIGIGKQWGTTWTDEFDYNINLKLLHSIVPELEDLNLMIGLGCIKTQIIDLIIYWALGLDNKNQDLLHTVIEGEPGTGKTELAEKIAKIYLKLGILKSNVFKKVKRADLVAGYLGQTAIKTAKIIEECNGGVLFIDEAYSLGNAEGKDGKDSFSKECIDTLNQALTESKSDFVCIIAGYADDLSKSFFSYNSGLERRFPIRFSIGTYTDEELGKIFIKKVREYEWDINLNSNELAQIIKSNRKYFKFNGGDMEILFAKCKISHSKNLLKSETKVKKTLDLEDILDGIKLYLLNPQIKSRGEEDNIKKYIYNTMYI
jgi:hypothetical protein